MKRLTWIVFLMTICQGVLVYGQHEEEHTTDTALLLAVLNLQNQSSNIFSGVEALYSKNIEQQMVQTKCVACHVEGGLADNARLKFLKGENNDETNFNALKDYLSIYGVSADLLLSKIRGINHTGGTQMSTTSDLYGHIEEVANQIENLLQQ